MHFKVFFCDSACRSEVDEDHFPWWRENTFSSFLKISHKNHCWTHTKDMFSITLSWCKANPFSFKYFNCILNEIYTCKSCILTHDQHKMCTYGIVECPTIYVMYSNIRSINTASKNVAREILINTTKKPISWLCSYLKRWPKVHQSLKCKR